MNVILILEWRQISSSSRDGAGRQRCCALWTSGVSTNQDIKKLLSCKHMHKYTWPLQNESEHLCLSPQMFVSFISLILKQLMP